MMTFRGRDMKRRRRRGHSGPRALRCHFYLSSLLCGGDFKGFNGSEMARFPKVFVLDAALHVSDLAEQSVFTY